MKPHFIDPHTKIVYNEQNKVYDILVFHDDGWTHYGWDKIKSFSDLTTAINWARRNSTKIYH